MSRVTLKQADLNTAAAEYKLLRSNDYGSGTFTESIENLVALLKIDGGVWDTFLALCKNGPLDAGDIPSKSGRTVLIEAGICTAVLNKGDFQHAVYGSFDTVWAYIKEEQAKVFNDAAERLKNQYETLTVASKGNYTSELRVLHLPIGCNVPEPLVGCTISFNELIDFLERGLSAPTSKFVIIYKKVPAAPGEDDNYLETRAQYFSDVDGIHRISEAFHFMSKYTVRYQPDSNTEFELVRCHSDFRLLGYIPHSHLLELIAV